MASAIESYSVDLANGFTLAIDEDGNTVINGGENRGLVKLPEIHAAIQALENKVNSLITKYNTHTHVSASPGSPNSPTPVTESAISITTI